MYSTKKNVLQLVALLKAHGIRHAVLCPGSRNAPVVQTLAACLDFNCYSIVDERSAAFFAIGLAQEHKEAVAVCCTSGTALLNMAPAVAEAFYQEIPLVVISADRPEAWIRQKDGQTLPQQAVFGELVKYSAHLPEPQDAVSSWHCNRLINEALLALYTSGNGPVHINIPITEPFFDFSEISLPPERWISAIPSISHFPEITERWEGASRVMLIVGQMLPDALLTNLIGKIEAMGGVIVYEHLANYPGVYQEGSTVYHPDWNLMTAVVSLLPEKERFYPDLVLYTGGHIVSKSIKQFLRKLSAQTQCIQVHPNECLTDTFMQVTHRVTGHLKEVLQEIVSNGTPKPATYLSEWKQIAAEVYRHTASLSPSHCSIYYIRRILESLPAGSALQLANSNTVRLAELATFPEAFYVYCNRGTSGIEGSLSTAAGYASAYSGFTFFMTGDLSYFYDLNILRHSALFPRLRVVLLHNGGGEIFRILPGMHRASELNSYIAASHSQDTAGWLTDCGIVHYYAGTETADTESVIREFLNDQQPRPVLLELRLDAENDRLAYDAFYASYRKK